VPLIVRAPGIAPGVRPLGVAQLEDLMPTILSLLGQPVPEGLDGQDLLPWLRSETPSSPRAAVLGRRAALEALGYAE
jgi:arylsulfatase A-like enzyme